MFQEALTYDDVVLEPKHSDIESRKEIHIGNELKDARGRLKFDLPIISSPMDTVTEVKMCEVMNEVSGLGIIHRYNSIDEQVEMIQALHDTDDLHGAAVGVTGDYLERAEQLYFNGADVICIDVAHGDHVLVERALKTLKDNFAEGCHIMAGNVATAEGFSRLAEWGADSIRVGIGGGSICSTRLNTGHGIPNLSSIMACYQVFRGQAGPKIIADGGIRNAGDIVKALAAGADFVMCGSMLAGTDEAPGELLNIEGKLCKEYRGMASREAQNSWRGSSSSPEGIATIIPHKGSVKNILKDLAGNIRSGFSYSGARNIKELREKASFIKQSPASVQEGFTHILNK